MTAVTDQIKASVGHTGGSKNDINISLGGHGLGIAACVIMLVAAGFLMFQLSDTRDELRAVREEMREHSLQLNAIYMMAPHLKPEPKQEPKP